MEGPSNCAKAEEAKAFVTARVESAEAAAGLVATSLGTIRARVDAISARAAELGGCAAQLSKQQPTMYLGKVWTKRPKNPATKTLAKGSDAGELDATVHRFDTLTDMFRADIKLSKRQLKVLV